MSQYNIQIRLEIFCKSIIYLNFHEKSHCSNNNYHEIFFIKHCIFYYYNVCIIKKIYYGIILF